MKRHFLLPTLALATTLPLVGCGAITGPGKSTPASSSEVPAMSVTPESPIGHNQADTTFAQKMLPHHQQAVQMSETMLSKNGIDGQIADLATRIKDAQGPEIQTMAGWLGSWRESVAAGNSMDGHDMESMNGMMTEEQVKNLDAADGIEASRMFLESMTEHHRGAVSMAKDEIANGQNTEAITLAKDVVRTQQGEIKEMESLLASL